MTRTSKVIAIILSGVLVLSGVSAEAMAADVPTATKKLTLTVGKSKKIIVKGNKILSKTFQTNKKKIATVNKKGVVKAKKAGKCKITVKVKYRNKVNKIATKKLICSVTVKKQSLKRM